MRRNSPAYYSPPRRGYGGGGRGGGGGGGGGGSGRRGFGGGRRRDSNGSLLVRNIPLDCRPEELRVPFERFGPVRDVYIPKDYYSGEPRGFAFVQFVDPYDASEAQYHMNRQIFAGREISVVVAEETRKRPEEMRHRTSRLRGPAGYGGQRSSRYGRSRSRSVTRSRSPPYHSGSRNRYRSRHVSLKCLHFIVHGSMRQAEHPRSPRGPPRERDGEQKRRSYSPAYGNGNLCTSLMLIVVSGSRRDHHLDLDQDLLNCHQGVEDEVAGRWQCAVRLLYISCNLS
ncbi:Serine/arginine-rich SC35-like splicing factor SCL30 isoform F [Glycine soja]|uniref:Serine/arginine-rich SC35-like splicing factor SCL30 isoform F n=1 Tax=Glycine soja TaxID=3848 RepID=A0A445LTS2_GLYSO|nr:Serine/arginine-rich SC35-like splicing factor SCL30 isoform F [Glycine soja]